MQKITIDTGILVGHKLGHFDLVALVKKHALNIAVVTVTERELKAEVQDILQIQEVAETMVWGESPWGVGEWAGPILETAVCGESICGKTILGGRSSENALEVILKILSNGGFPKQGERQSLTEGQKHQLRDAMILEAHIRKKRDFFISNDKRAFIGKSNNEKRQQIEAQFSIRIMTLDEFVQYLNKADFIRVAGSSVKQ